MSFAVHALPALKDNFIYMLVDRGSKSAVTIDPGDALPVLDFLKSEGLSLKHILLTHHHPDHTGGAPELQQKTQAPITCSKYDQMRIPLASKGLSEGETLDILGENLEVIEVPGHTHGQISFWFKERLEVFVGDTLFSGGCGRLFEGTFAQMHHSLEKLKRLPKETKIYFGHEYTLSNLRFILEQSQDPNLRESVQAYAKECQNKLAIGQPTTPTTLANELQINPFLMADSVSEFTTWREARNSWAPKP